ncbi:hypothetical protein [Defluviitalea saccharophila]|uniref:Uncharacterized protein n=1 Tax=Defluviitalea saccharophila TaxID=879970 RepID=A0ABZ2Y876_9FIRM|nr:hypothetical protein [Candidatus Epulonipiscium sp.]
MEKEKGFANFTPDQAEEFMKQEKKNKPQDPYAGEQRHKQKQKAMNKKH